MAILGKVDYVIRSYARPYRVDHESDYWLTVDREGGTLRLWKHHERDFARRKPSDATGRWHGMPANIECPEAFRPLADPTKPVRIRLKLQAERIDE